MLQKHNNKPIYRSVIPWRDPRSGCGDGGMHRVAAEWSWGLFTRSGLLKWMAGGWKESQSYSHTQETRWPFWRAPSTMHSASELLLPDSLWTLPTLVM